MASKTLNIALIGSGFMGRAHSNAYCQAPHFFDLPFSLRRRVICGRNAAALAEMARTWEWEEVSTDWRGVVERDDIDIVDIAAPNVLHAEMALAAAAAGKIVLCEKPLAVSVEEGLRMVAAVRDLPNMVWFNYRRTPGIALARRLVEEERLERCSLSRYVFAGVGERSHPAAELEDPEGRGGFGRARGSALAPGGYRFVFERPDHRGLGYDAHLCGGAGCGRRHRPSGAIRQRLGGDV